ncbi:MAG: HAMP domain-containing histidine kinase [Proteobacteria bacterium]|nr:HAMP domain-containing histidine kinase [Pseudomonadota bacterium]
MQEKRPTFFNSLSSQLLVLIILFVMMIEVLIYVPSLAEFRKDYLDRRLVMAQVAALSLEEVPGQAVSSMLEEELLSAAEIQAVIVIRDDSRQLILRGDMPSRLEAVYDLRNPTSWELVVDAFTVLGRGGTGSIQVEGKPLNTRHQSVLIVLREAPLFEAMVAFSKSILITSLVISLATAGLVFLSIMIFLVRPTKRITDNLTRFAAQPELERNTLKVSGRRNEIGLLEDQISHMQREIQKALQQKKHLTSLGLAVSKINHDLRNILATAQLSIDRLTSGKAKENQEQVMARLLRSVDRAVRLGERTLKYGKAEEPPPDKKTFLLAGLVAEVRESLRDGARGGPRWVVKIPKTLKVNADREQLFRVLLNLCGNAIEAMEGAGTLTITGKADGKEHLIRVKDTGPGIPERLQESLFIPFAGSTKGSGYGLGLAIAQELVRAHNGEILLEKSDPTGSVFCICLPAKQPRKN